MTILYLATLSLSYRLEKNLALQKACWTYIFQMESKQSSKNNVTVTFIYIILHYSLLVYIMTMSCESQEPQRESIQTIPCYLQSI